MSGFDRQPAAQLVVGDGGEIAFGVLYGLDLADGVVVVGGGDLLAVVVLRYRQDPVMDVAVAYFGAFDVCVA